MKQYKLSLLMISLIAYLGLSAVTPPEKISLGAKVPYSEVSMKDVSGKSFSLDQIKKKNGLLIVFAANKCVAIKYWGDRLLEIARYAEKNKVGVVWVNSNQTQRSAGESLDDMQAFAKARDIKFPYVMDDDFLLANSFGVEVTPTSYLFDADSQLVFQGLVDDNMTDASAATKNYLQDALSSMIKNQSIPTKEIFGRGCRIPRE